MDYQFRFWHSLLNPSKLAFALDNQEQDYQIKGYRSRFFILLGITILFFVIRSIWGMGSENLTYLLAENLEEEYIVSRYLSVFGAVVKGLLFFAFHYYFISICLAILTDHSFRAISKIQLFVLASILLEKVILFSVFTLSGFTTAISFLSLGPISTYITDDSFVIYFFNQLTIATAASIYIQYNFLSRWEEESKGLLLTKIIGLHIFFALVTAGISILPLYDYVTKVVGL
ncbi:hypothetical protein [Lysinibacillus sp. SGAir0095]|uniref:hypothetical protein n=1 Tax=Lysinibacillus sp. SGAir0095 TaxID=2070463 RepID=UPI0010CD5F0C|nr:hypothetical protein [Lysinibacillus sp. SGAir0095]QCR32948.1 hypothetical protein C1N55_12525 [Lysinibacillus sp. SGAir0095]